MRAGFLWMMNIYAVFFSFYLLIVEWGPAALLLLFLGPAISLLAPLLTWIFLGDSLYILLITVGNIIGFLVLIGPALIDEKLPKNKTISFIRLIIISFVALVLIPQGFALIGIMLSELIFEGSAGYLPYVISAIGGIFGGYYFVAFNEDSEFFELLSKNILYAFTICINLIMIIGNLNVLDVYVVNGVVCLLASLYFVKIATFKGSLKEVDTS